MYNFEKRKTGIQKPPMRYRGGRFDKDRYQRKQTTGTLQDEANLYEVDHEAIKRS